MGPYYHWGHPGLIFYSDSEACAEVNECYDAFHAWLSAFYLFSVVSDQVGQQGSEQGSGALYFAIRLQNGTRVENGDPSQRRNWT